MPQACACSGRPARKRAIVKIDRIVLISVIVGAGLAVLSTVGTETRPAALGWQTSAGPADAAPSFP